MHDIVVHYRTLHIIQFFFDDLFQRSFITGAQSLILKFIRQSADVPSQIKRLGWSFPLYNSAKQSQNPSTLVHIPRILLFLRNLLCLGEVFFFVWLQNPLCSHCLLQCTIHKKTTFWSSRFFIMSCVFLPRVPVHLVPPECVPRVFKPRVFLDLFIFYF